jgi:hypothetical protein
VREVGGQGIEQLFGFVRVAGLQQREREVQAMLGLVGFGFDEFAQAHRFCVRIDRCGGRGIGGGRFVRRLCRHDAVVREEFAQLAFRQCAGESVDKLAALDEVDGRDRTHLERAGELLFLVDVDLRQAERAVVFVGEFFEDRAERLAGPAPLGPEVDKHGHLQRALQDIGFEGVGGGVENVRGSSGGHGGSQAGDGRQMGAMPRRGKSAR